MSEKSTTADRDGHSITDADGPPAPEVRASRLLRAPAIWISPAILASVLIFLMTLIYVGSVVDPASHLSGLPVLMVNEDQGVTVSSQHIDIGQEVVSALDHSHPVTSRLSLQSTTFAQAKAQMNQNAGYLTIVVPQQFTHSLLSIYGLGKPGQRAPPIPTITLLTNQRAGSIGGSLATGVAHPALAQISRKIGQQLSAQAAVSSKPTADATAIALDPVTLAAVPYRPLPPHSALGLSAFYISLLSIMCGFIAAAIVNSAVDSALGYATSEIGPRWSQRLPVSISRWQTLLAKWLIAVVIVPLLAGLMLVAAVGILHMDASSVGYLWLFTSFAGIVVAIGTLTLFAALGTLGQLVALLVFVYLALASSGGTVPIQALPGVLRFAATFEPLRQILDGVRAILYFNASGPAGLTRGFVMTAVGLVCWVLLGVAVTTWYDRRGLYRMQPDVMAYVNRSVRGYKELSQDQLPPAASKSKKERIS
jgi:YhgE/Pip-like protein